VLLLVLLWELIVVVLVVLLAVGVLEQHDEAGAW
jgi:hypothetical protein